MKLLPLKVALQLLPQLWTQTIAFFSTKYFLWKIFYLNQLSLINLLINVLISSPLKSHLAAACSFLSWWPNAVVKCVFSLSLSPIFLCDPIGWWNMFFPRVFHQLSLPTNKVHPHHSVSWQLLQLWEDNMCFWLGSHPPFIFQHRVLMKRLKKQCKSGCESAHGSIPRSFGNIDLLQWHLFSHILFSDIFDFDQQYGSKIY